VLRRVAPAFLVLSAALLHSNGAFAQEAAADAKRELAGAAVVASGTVDDALGQDCRALAREIYKSAALRPSIDEGTAKTLCGGEAGIAGTGAVDAQPRKIGELRASLGTNLDNATARLVVQALVDELGVQSLVLVSRTATGPQVRVVRAHMARGKLGITIEGTRLSPSAKGEPLAIPWAETAAAVELLLSDEGEAQGDGSVTPIAAVSAGIVVSPGGPRKSNLLAARPTEAPGAAPEKAFYESPWFWVAVGSVAAVGLTVLIVSQATNVDEGSVNLQGEVLP